MRRRSGFMMAEMLFALALIGTAAVIWVSAVARVNRADRGLADGRDASYLAERALLAMRSGNIATQSSDRVKITVQRCDGGKQFHDYTWVYVEATVGQRRAGLVGLVPASAMKARGQ